MKNVVLLGSTGSIGTSTVKVAEDLPDRIRLVGLAAGNNAELLLEQARKHRPDAISINRSRKSPRTGKLPRAATQVYSGDDGLIKLATLPGGGHRVHCHRRHGRIETRARRDPRGQGHCHRVEGNSRHGRRNRDERGAQTRRSRARRGQRAFGDFSVSRRQTVQFRPQTLADGVRRTVSRHKTGPRKNFPNITVERALKHPSWVMGRKITIDSATLFNKGLEMIEARWLFDIGIERVGVLVHPQSIVHSMVEFVDGALLAQLSTPDMCLPIQYALDVSRPRAERAGADRFRQAGQPDV